MAESQAAITSVVLKRGEVEAQDTEWLAQGSLATEVQSGASGIVWLLDHFLHGRVLTLSLEGAEKNVNAIPPWLHHLKKMSVASCSKT